MLCVVWIVTKSYGGTRFELYSALPSHFVEHFLSNICPRSAGRRNADPKIVHFEAKNRAMSGTYVSRSSLPEHGPQCDHHHSLEAICVRSASFSILPVDWSRSTRKHIEDG